jgi:predicted dienelactone hydrolase
MPFSRFALALFFCAGAAAQNLPGEPFSVPPVDAPDLAPRGRWPVGVRTLSLVNPGQIDILHFDKDSNKAPLYDRPLTVEIWYPATLPAGAVERVTYESPMPAAAIDAPKSFKVPGKALRDAPPASGERFPLVVVSHGYPGSRTFLTYLTENLASKGYVVAAIDHTDSVFGAQAAFTSTLLNRSADQWFTIETLQARSRAAGDFLNGLVDGSRVAIVGYSMGGYGALTSAGAGYSRQGGSARAIPGGYFEDWLAGSAKFEARQRPGLKAVVAIAPWGMQPPNSNWDAQGLAGIHVPSLFIVGDQDDVSGYEQGVRKLFEGAVNSERRMLVYENARHNVGGNPTPPEAMGSFAARAFFEEPVWRKDRIAAINQHFITAFLDLYVKGDESRRPYLDLPVKSTDGASFWKGFQRRWALGMQMYRYPANTAK